MFLGVMINSRSAQLLLQVEGAERGRPETDDLVENEKAMIQRR